MARAVTAQGTDDWYLSTKEGTRGPVSLARLQQLVAAGRVKAGSRVKTGLEGDWRRVDSIDQLQAALPQHSEVASVERAKTSPGHDALSQTPPRGFSVADVASTPGSRGPSRSDGIRSASAGASIVATSSKAAGAGPVSADSAAQILERLRSALDSRAIASFNNIELEFSNDVVLARGTMTTEGERLLAMHVLQKSAGSVRVISTFTLNQGARPGKSPAPSRIVPPKAVSHGSRASFEFSQLLDALKGLSRSQLIAGTAAVALLGFWFIPRGPVRPVAVHPVQGKVILDGQPLANAAIVLHRVGDSKLPANLHPRGKASEDGTFKLETFDPADGAPEGEFVATVFLTEQTEVDGETQAGPNLLPAVYSKPETSPLKLKITAATRELHPLELTKG